jgi:cephalosporin hydroxylase
MNLDLMDFRPYGVPVLQSPVQPMLYLRAIDKYNIDLFVEIGYWFGGLAGIIAAKCIWQPGFCYLGIEHDQAYIDKGRVLAHENAVYLRGNCFSEEFADTLRKAMASSQHTFLFCDGGNKPRELAHFAPMLRVGDLIAAHDYADEVLWSDYNCLMDHGWREREPDVYRAALVPLWEKIA